MQWIASNLPCQFCRLYLITWSIDSEILGAIQARKSAWEDGLSSVLRAFDKIDGAIWF
jgi:hypothetical protein